MAGKKKVVDWKAVHEILKQNIPKLLEAIQEVLDEHGDPAVKMKLMEHDGPPVNQETLPSLDLKTILLLEVYIHHTKGNRAVSDDGRSVNLFLTDEERILLGTLVARVNKRVPELEISIYKKMRTFCRHVHTYKVLPSGELPKKQSGLPSGTKKRRGSLAGIQDRVRNLEMKRPDLLLTPEGVKYYPKSIKEAAKLLGVSTKRLKEFIKKYRKDT